MKLLRRVAVMLVVACTALPSLHAFEKQPASTYRARRVALGARVGGGVAVLFAAKEPVLDFMAYRQDADFYYLTGWTEPGAALLVAGAGGEHGYREILFLPTRNLRLEQYTGAKMDASTPGVAARTGVDEVKPMTELPAVLNGMIAKERKLARNLWAEPESGEARALGGFVGTTLGMDAAPEWRDVAGPVGELRQVKDAGEVALLRKAAAASMAAQMEMMRAVRPGVTELAVAGRMGAVWAEHGCERPSYAPIVGSGINSTMLHYAENSKRIEAGDLVVVDAACEYSMYAADITRTVPADGHFTARQREIYNIVLGAQRAAIEAFVAGHSTINDYLRSDANSLDTVAYNYINTHGKGPQGEALGKYWLHGLGHMVGIDVHDPAQYPAVLRPGMVFTIEPGIYIPEEKLGVRIECHFLVGEDGKLIDLDEGLPLTAEEIERAMRGDK